MFATRDCRQDQRGSRSHSQFLGILLLSLLPAVTAAVQSPDIAPGESALIGSSAASAASYNDLHRPAATAARVTQTDKGHANWGWLFDRYGCRGKCDGAQAYVSDLIFVASRRISKTVVENTYRIKVVNRGPALDNAVAFASTKKSNLKLIDNEVILGRVDAGRSVVSIDTFTLQIQGVPKDKDHYPFDLKHLDWEILASGVNSPPVANAGPDQTARTGEIVTLDGSASTDANGDPLSYSWSVTLRPSGSTATLSSTSDVRPSFRLDRAGTYAFSLVVNDGNEDSSPDEVRVSTINSAPIAHAGTDRTVPRNSTVTLDGSGSSDPDFDVLAFYWSIFVAPAGSTAGLIDADTMTPRLTLDLPGDFTLRLVVSDGALTSSPDEVTISTENSAPVANAGPDQSGRVGDRITLDGSASNDADGDYLSFSWSLTSRPAGSAAALTDADLPQAHFVADAAGLYVVQLIVHDGFADSSPDTTVVTILVTNRAPAAVDDVATTAQDTVVLVAVLANDSDPDGDALNISAVGIPSSGVAAIQGDAVLYTPAAGFFGMATFDYTVSDGNGGSDTARVTVTVTPTEQNRPPVANAGEQQSVPAGTTVALSGLGSTDPDGDTLSYAWRLLSFPTGSAANLVGADTATPSFVVDLRGTYELELTVSDGRGGSDTDGVTVTAANRAPVANDDTANTNDATAIDIAVLANDTDADGDTLTITAVGTPASGSATIDGDVVR